MKSLTVGLSMIAAMTIAVEMAAADMLSVAATAEVL
jgi:hypothetical protein